MASEHDKKPASDSNSKDKTRAPKKGFLMVQALLRILAIAFTVAAMSVMVSSSQDVVVYSISFMARYTYSSALKFLLGVDVVVCAFSVLSLIFVCVLRRSDSNPNHYFFLFVHDTVMMVLMISGCAAATAIGYIGRYGEANMGWVAVCKNVEQFCNKVLVSTVLSYLVSFSYLALTLLSARELTSSATV